MSSFHSEVLNAYTDFSEGVWFSDDPELVYDRIKTPGQSAVLCCLGKRRDGQVCVLLTKRSNKMSLHAGEVSFPGGKMEPYDSSLEETALREAEEEVNLSRHQVEVVGYLPFGLPFLNRRYYLCSGVLCTLKGEIEQLENLKANSEVEAIFWAPLDLFVNGSSDHWNGSMRVKNKRYAFDFFRCKPDSADSSTHIIFGMTARYCMLMAMLVLKHCTHWPVELMGVSQIRKGIVYLSYLRLPNNRIARSKL